MVEIILSSCWIKDRQNFFVATEKKALEELCVFRSAQEQQREKRRKSRGPARKEGSSKRKETPQGRETCQSILCIITVTLLRVATKQETLPPGDGG